MPPISPIRLIVTILLRNYAGDDRIAAPEMACIVAPFIEGDCKRHALMAKKAQWKCRR
jgi:hypothetical protein